MPAQPDSSAQPLLNKVLDELGSEIVDGILEEGHTFTLQDLSARFDISRTVAREAMRALEQLGLVSSSRRVGIKVLPQSEWAVFDQSIIDWRLRSETQRKEQVTSLNQLRQAVEPVAASLAASQAKDVQIAELRELAAKLFKMSEAGLGKTDDFLEADKRFHTLILEASGNEMFATLATPIVHVLEGRTRYGMMPDMPELDAMRFHIDLVEAIAQNDANAAEKASRSLLRGVDGFVEF